jgi:hypothetical protein
MSRLLVFRCDACGRKMKNDERAEGAIVLPDERAKAAGQHPTLMDWVQGNAPKMKEEHFDLCIECALALLVAFKVRKKAAEAGHDLLES